MGRVTRAGVGVTRGRGGAGSGRRGATVGTLAGRFGGGRRASGMRDNTSHRNTPVERRHGHAAWLSSAATCIERRRSAPAGWGIPDRPPRHEERREGPVANEALRVAMAEAGETVESLAEKVCVDPKTAARWLAAGRIPHPRTRVAVAKVLRREAADLWPEPFRRRDLPWFRPWAELEQDATSLRSVRAAVGAGSAADRGVRPRDPGHRWAGRTVRGGPDRGGPH